MTELVIAAAVWIVTHLGISSTGLRQRLAGTMGEKGYLVLYSLIAAAALAWLILAYSDAPRDQWLWAPASWQRWVTVLLMVPAFVLLAGGLMGANPSAVGQGNRVGGADRGVLRVTRHPVQWAFLLWAVGHMVSNGDLAALLLTGSIAVVAGAGTVLIDRKKSRQLGEAWEAFRGRTSNLPFAAIAQGRNRLAWRELLVPVAVGLVLYVVVFASHRWIAGVPVTPL